MIREVLLIKKTSYIEATGVLARGFEKDPVMLAVYSGCTSEERAQKVTAGMAGLLKVCIHRGWSVGVREESRIIGVCAVYPPGIYPLPITTQLSIFASYIAKKGFGGMGRWAKVQLRCGKWHPKEPHYYLELISVDPSMQGKGVGSFLLQQIVAKADQEQVGCYLENSNLRNLLLYERFGFETVHKEKVIGVDIWFMWRQPNRF